MLLIVYSINTALIVYIDLYTLICESGRSKVYMLLIVYSINTALIVYIDLWKREEYVINSIQ